MAKMSSLSESYLLFVIKSSGVLFRALPLALSLGIARLIGRMGPLLMPIKMAVIYSNLRIVYGHQKTPQQLRVISRKCFMNLAQSFVEILCLPKLKKLEFKGFVEVVGKEYIDAAMAKGNGLIFLAIHSGNWELASMVGSACGYPYNIVANQQPKVPQLDVMLNEFRRIAGAKVIAPGESTRDIIRALRNNEIVSLALDQGGQEGIIVDFFGRTASMSVGALRLGLKYKTAICPVWITRQKNGTHRLEVMPDLGMHQFEDSDEGLRMSVKKSAFIFEKLLRDHPEEYLWSYKVFKYSSQAHVCILDDGKTGHLRQSQALAQEFEGVLRKRGKDAVCVSIAIIFQSRFKKKLFQFFAFVSMGLGFLRKEEFLSFFLVEDSYQGLLKIKPDYIISCASSMGSLNYFLKHCYSSKSFCILRAGLIPWDQFDFVTAPAHDKIPDNLKCPVVRTKAALNLITSSYLKMQTELLLNRYSHLKNNVRTKVGVLLGGDAKGVVLTENMIKNLLRQIKEAALHFNVDILITTSRRTSVLIDGVVAKELKSFERLALMIIANEQNPSEAVGGILGLSDIVIVSGESISMVSEAVSSNKPTIVFTINDTDSGKYNRFVRSLSEDGYVYSCAVKDIGIAIQNIMRQKMVLNKFDDRKSIREALEKQG